MLRTHTKGMHMMIRQYSTVSSWIDVSDVPGFPEEVRESTKLVSSELVFGTFRKVFDSFPEERFCIAMLNTQRQVTGFATITVGSLDASIVHPREVFAPAIAQRSHSIIAMHNHPSGNSTPSIEDRRITKRLVACGILLGIEVLDHMVFGYDSYYSFRSSEPMLMMNPDVNLNLLLS